MKNLLYISTILLLISSSCSKSQGCTDVNATNYDSQADESDNSCLYDLVGVWNMTSYQVNGVNATSQIDTYRVTFYDDGSYYSEQLLISLDNGNGGDWIDVWGISDVNADQTTITLQNQLVDYYNGNGQIADSEYGIYDITELDNNNITLEMTATSAVGISSLILSFTKQ
jgi:hypothetical protein